MEIQGQPSILAVNNIITGYYIFGYTGDNPSKPRLFEISSASYPISKFSAPYDAYLKNSSGGYLAVGRKVTSPTSQINSNISGGFFYNDPVELIGTCHGYGRDELTFYTGFNFYNAFYPAGYFAPSYGENYSIFKINQDGIAVLDQFACSALSITEYNETFGIISEVASEANESSSMLTPGVQSPIMSVQEVCPPDIAVPFYYDELNAKRIPGTVSSLGATTLYNNNPIPTSLDNYEIQVDGRYKYTPDNVDKVNQIEFGSDLRPLPNYNNDSSNHSKLNNPLCFAQAFETDILVGKLSNGEQKINVPDVLNAGIGDEATIAGQEPYHYWNFIFRENAETLPFSNDFQGVLATVGYPTANQGTQLFNPILSSEDYYWENRQCPSTVDFLPWTFGASIYACPSKHFDIPYYAAIKKFGFYGTRFLTSCSKLNLKYTFNNVANSIELPPQSGPLDVQQPNTEPDGIDLQGNNSFTAFDSLLSVAKAEERYSNFFALNQGFFIWANVPYILGDPLWPSLTGDNGFLNLLSNLTGQFQNIYNNGLSSLFSGEPIIIEQKNTDLITTSFLPVDSGQSNELLFSNEAYMGFLENLYKISSGTTISSWKQLENKYSRYISNGQGGVNEQFYRQMSSGRDKRILTRYFENIVQGNPVDLFPLNHIVFSTDNARDYMEDFNWARSTSSFGANSPLPKIQKIYFEGAYGNSSAIGNIETAIKQLSLINSSAFYPGFFNDYNFSKNIPTPSYFPVESGAIIDKQGHKFSINGWMAAGYNEIGNFDKNFSCFTPIITQQPLDKVFCKIGQRPTLRVSAVDYHSIPDDKISFRWPEIAYWAYNLKLVDNEFNNLYPLKYKWFRVLKSKYNNFLVNSDFSLAEFSNPAGNWCAFEGDTNTCTIINPKLCVPPYSINSPSIDDYTFIKGIIKNTDDAYYYMCLIIGRFGVRISEPAELIVEDWIRFDVSCRNGVNAVGNISVNFIVNDYNGTDNTISLQSSSNSAAYQGYQLDVTAIPESVMREKVPPPNAGFGDVSAQQFIGSIGYIGTTRSYVPDTLQDTRGLREIWGRFLDYGVLVPLSKRLSQEEGDLLYGYQHLPRCSNYSMANGQKGIKVEASIHGSKVSHWTLSQQAFAALDNSQGILYTKIGTVGALYPPANNILDIESPSKIGLGHWQWANNLGSIKRFGKFSFSSDNDIVLLGKDISPNAPMPDQVINTIKQNLIAPTTLAGKNCGYTQYGLGRNMIYYIEAFDRFYTICDPTKKKNVQDIAFMSPGLRLGNSATQYFWMGQPNNTYVERRPMYGPYAYQWRVRRHNRDRNGNGISDGFYSMGYNSSYSLIYDAPAVYGLYSKRDSSSYYMGLVNNVLNLRQNVAANIDISTLRSFWFASIGQGAIKYGDFNYSCDTQSVWYNNDICQYVTAVQSLAANLDFQAYSCSQENLMAGKCFDPCLSMRYGQGFFPGGKLQSMFGYQNSSSQNLAASKNTRLVNQANLDENNMVITTDEQSIIDPAIYFRSPVNTPHALTWRGKLEIDGTQLNTSQNIYGISPCKDGGSEHCNFITPTLHLDTTSVLLGAVSNYNGSINRAANLWENYQVRGVQD